MSTGIITGPTAEPVTLAQIKDELRMASTVDDTTITSLITPARVFAEKACGFSLVSKTYQYSMRGFPWPHESILLPIPPVSAVNSITYLDCNGDSQTWASSEYMTGLTQIPAVRRPRPSYTYPDTMRNGDLDTVFVQFVAGPTAGAPLVLDLAPALEGVVRLVIHFYEHPEAINADDLKEMPLGIQTLLTTRKYRPVF